MADETNLSFKQQKKVKKVELIELKLLICKQKLESEHEGLVAMKREIINKIEEVFKPKLDRIQCATREINQVLSNLKIYKKNMSNELDSILKSYKTSKLKGILNSDFSPKSIDLIEIRNMVRLSLEPSEAEVSAANEKLLLNLINLSLSSRYKELEERSHHKDVLISSYIKEIQGLHQDKKEIEYYRSIIPLINEKLKFHMIFSGFIIQEDENTIEAFCRYLAKTHFPDLSFEFSTEYLEQEGQRRYCQPKNQSELNCEICRHLISDKGYDQFKGIKLCTWCLHDQITGVLEVNFPLTCPRNHALIRYEYRIANATRKRLRKIFVYCNRCQITDYYNRIWYCYECDYDLCLSCYEEIK
jgi:hypothetical protein